MLTYLDKFITAAELLQSGRLTTADIVEIDRIIYSHWVLYIGNGEVVHVAGTNSDIPPSGSDAFVMKCKFSDVAGDGLVRINNKVVPARERGIASLSSEDTVKDAMEIIGMQVNHNLMTKNSEHFVTKWKYGVCWSDQAEAAFHGVFSSSPQTDPQEANRTMVSGIQSLLKTAHHCDQRETTHGRLSTSPPVSPTRSVLISELNRLCSHTSSEDNSP